MYEFKPQRKNKNAALLLLFLFSAAAALFVSAVLFPKLQLLLQAGGLFLCLFAVNVISRFYGTWYLYRLREVGERVMLEIFGKSGKRAARCLLYVELSRVRYVKPLSAEIKKPPQNVPRVSFSPDFLPSEGLVIGFFDGKAEAEALLSPDSMLEEILTRALRDRGGFLRRPDGYDPQFPDK